MSRVRIEIGPELWQDLRAMGTMLDPASELADIAAAIRDELARATEGAAVVQVVRPPNMSDEDAAAVSELWGGKPIEWVDWKSPVDKKEDA